MSSTTTLSGQQGSYFATQDILFAAFYTAIVFPGVIGNGIIITIVRKTPSMHTTTNYLLMNLAVADLLTLLLCPGLYDFALTEVRLQGFLGDVICKLFAGNAVVPITINVAILTVCTIAVERYLALVKPFRNLRLTKDSVGYVIALLWLIALLSCVPDIQANTFDIESNKYPCKRPWSLDEYYLHKSFIIFTCICFGFLSFLIIFICYFEIVRGLYFTQTICSETSANETERHEKKQLARLLIWLAIIFAVCSLPFASFFSILFPPTTQLSSINMKRCIYCIEYLGFCFLQIRFLIRFYTHYKAATIATTLGFSLNPRYAVVNHSKVIPFKIPATGRELQEPFPLIIVNTP